MRKRLALIALVAVAFMTVVAFKPHRTFADERDFTLVNGSNSVTIVHVYVSAADVDDWQEDVLGRDVLAPGDYVNIHFSKFDSDAGKCFYDIRVDGDGGERGILTKVNLCATDTVTFS
jgi:hypothetical protein